MTASDKALDELLDAGLDDWMMATHVAFFVRRASGIDDEEAERQMAIEVIRMAVEGGWMRLGDYYDDVGFVAWDLDKAAALERVRTAWEALDRPVNLYEVCWLENTAAGDARARAAVERGSSPVEPTD